MYSKLFLVRNFRIVFVFLCLLFTINVFAEKVIIVDEFEESLYIRVDVADNACLIPDGHEAHITVNGEYGNTYSLVQIYTGNNVAYHFVRLNFGDTFLPGETLTVAVEIKYYGIVLFSRKHVYSANVNTTATLDNKPYISLNSISTCYADKIIIEGTVNNNLLPEEREWSLEIDVYDGTDFYNKKYIGTVTNYEGSNWTFTHNNLSGNKSIEYLFTVRYIPPSYASNLSSSFDINFREKTGQTFDINLTASTTESNRIVLNWNEACWETVTGYKIERYKNGIYDYKTITINSKEQTNEVDESDLVPGYYYEYRISTLPEPSLYNDSAFGKTKANGRIEGRVTIESTGAGVEGVTVIAKREDTVPSDTTTVYTATTNSSGNYVIDEIFYNESSEFTVTPVLSLHSFDPGKQEDVLLSDIPGGNIASAINFSDTSSYTINGNISLRTPTGACPMSGVKLFVNGLDHDIETDVNGDYSLVVATAGSYTITPGLADHLFEPEETTLDVYDHITGLDFSDTTAFQLDGYVAASCNTFIGAAKLKISDLSSCFDTLVNTDPTTGYYSVDLPAQKYRFEVVEFVSADENLVATQDVVDYFKPDTISGIVYADTSHNMIYRLPPTLTVTPENLSASCNTIIMEQGVSGDFTFTVTEEINGQGCNTDVGFVVVEQNITTDDIVTDTLPLVNGEATISLTPGEPKVTGDFLKELMVTAYIENEVVSEKMDVLVTGHAPRGSTYTTVTPEIPFLVLHDPPGDASYSYLEENTTIENTFSFSSANEASINAYSEIKLGAKFEAGVGFSVESAFWGTLKASTQIGGYVNTNDEWVYSLTNAEAYSTSGGDVVGADGDVYVGGAMNLIYAVTDIVTYNYNTCQAEKDSRLIIAPNGFATTYMYTEEHISDVLIPQLIEMQAFAEADGDIDKAIEYENQIEVWEQVMAQNAENIAKASFVENRSFSAGLSYESSIESSSSSSESIEIGFFIDNTVAVEIGAEVGGSGATAGVEVNFRVERGASGSSSTTHTHKTGFVLEDDDAGDFFSVDILTDQVYGTPAFRTKAGRSSCPVEENTQQREKLELSADSYRKYVGNDDDKAVFILEMTNLSGSNEEQTYNLMLDPTSNPDGAIVTIGGSTVFGNVVTPYTIPPFESVFATITVSKGPLATTYSGLKFTLESSCDGSISDDIYLDVVFPSTCSNMTLASDNFVANNDSVELQLSDYDIANIENFFVQACKVGGSTWYALKQYDVSSLNSDATTLKVPLSNVVDGEYKIRVKVTNEDTENYSNSISLLIDRTAPLVDGLPHPLDKELEAGDVVYINFNEYIDCGNTELDIQLLNASKNDAVIAFEYGCYNNKLIIKPNLTSVDSSNYINVRLTGISDIYGNINSDEIEWGFNVGNVQKIMDYSDSDLDNDGIIDTEDNCELAYNPEQEDIDNDNIGDVCDDDIDGDGILNIEDNCPFIANADQTDTNNNGVGDVCEAPDKDGDGVPDDLDNCPDKANADQEDANKNGIGDVCEQTEPDSDGDGVVDSKDNCPYVSNPNQADANNNGVGDACEQNNTDSDGDGVVDAFDNCLYKKNPNQEDLDKDGVGDVCDQDIDGDEVNNTIDNCPNDSNPDQTDTDGDGHGDLCDSDIDADGITNSLDNCPITPNENQEDTDGDGIGDACDGDLDGDGILNDLDNCPNIANPDQTDADDNGIGDICENDTDGDGVPDATDNCPTESNSDQADADRDGIGDICDNDTDGDEILNIYDNCPFVSNSYQQDLDRDGEGDMCDDDIDGDGIVNEIDNCPVSPNFDQTDTDGDGQGDECDGDIDGDGILNNNDNCPVVSNPDQKDEDNDGIGDLCELTAVTSLDKSELVCEVFPNPFTSEIRIKILSQENKEVQLEFYDMLSRLRTSKSVFISAGETIIEVETGDWKSGIYTYRIISGDNIIMGKVVKN